MALADYLTTKFVVMDKTTQEDKDFGGFITVWKEGAPFVGGLVMKNSADMLIAAQQGAKVIYTLVTDKKILLTRGMMVRRVQDKADFEITSDSVDMTTPARAGVQFSQVTAERVVL